MENMKKICIALFLLFASVAHVSFGMKKSDVPSAVAEHDECSICLGKMRGGRGLKTLVCGHTFHEGCLNRWLK